MTLPTTPPVISIVSPRPGADLYSPRSVTIEVEYTDLGSGVDPATAYLFVNDADATSELDATEERATLTLTGLRQGTYSVRFGVSDQAGNRNEVAWTFAHGVLGIVSSGTSHLRFDWSLCAKPLRLDLALTERSRLHSRSIRLKLPITRVRPVPSSGRLTT